MDVRQFDGMLFERAKATRIGDISQEWVLHQQRQRTTLSTQVHVTSVGTVNVLKANMSELNAGEPSVFAKELKGAASMATGKRKMQVFEHQVQ